MDRLPIPPPGPSSTPSGPGRSSRHGPSSKHPFSTSSLQVFFIVFVHAQIRKEAVWTSLFKQTRPMQQTSALDLFLAGFLKLFSRMRKEDKSPSGPGRSSRRGPSSKHLLSTSSLQVFFIVFAHAQRRHVSV
jgi:hypothetical protein